MGKVEKRIPPNSRRFCSVPGCSTYCSKDISLHCFPKDPKLRLKWKTILNIGKPISKFMYVCKKHFLPKDFMPITPRTVLKRLRRGVVPSQKLPWESDQFQTEKHVSDENRLKGDHMNITEIQTSIMDKQPTESDVELEQALEPSVSVQCENPHSVQESTRPGPNTCMGEKASQTEGSDVLHLPEPLNSNEKPRRCADELDFREKKMQMAHKIVRPRRFCSVPQCSTYATKDISIHFFPKDPELCQKWKEILNIGESITKVMFVCSQHFLVTDFMPLTPITLRRRLKKGAVPSQKLPCLDYLRQVNESRSDPNRLKRDYTNTKDIQKSSGDKQPTELSAQSGSVPESLVSVQYEESHSIQENICPLLTTFMDKAAPTMCSDFPQISQLLNIDKKRRCFTETQIHTKKNDLRCSTKKVIPPLETPISSFPNLHKMIKSYSKLRNTLDKAPEASSIVPNDIEKDTLAKYKVVETITIVVDE